MQLEANLIPWRKLSMDLSSILERVHLVGRFYLPELVYLGTHILYQYGIQQVVSQLFHRAYPQTDGKVDLFTLHPWTVHSVTTAIKQLLLH